MIVLTIYLFIAITLFCIGYYHYDEVKAETEKLTGKEVKGDLLMMAILIAALLWPVMPIYALILRRTK